MTGKSARRVEKSKCHSFLWEEKKGRPSDCFLEADGTAHPGNTQKRKKIIIRSNHCGFCKGKSYLTNLIWSCSEMTNLMDERGAVDIVFLDFSKVFWRWPRKIFLEKLLMMQWGGLKNGWMSRPRGQWSVLQSLTGGQLEAECAMGQYWIQSCLTYSLKIWMMSYSAPWVNLQLTQNWGQWFMRGLHSHPGRPGQAGRNLMKFSQGEVQSAISVCPAVALPMSTFYEDVLETSPPAPSCPAQHHRPLLHTPLCHSGTCI